MQKKSCLNPYVCRAQWQKGAAVEIEEVGRRPLRRRDQVWESAELESRSLEERREVADCDEA